METKAQLRIAAQAYERRVGGLDPIGTISVASNGDVQSLTLSLACGGHLWARETFSWPSGHLVASRAEMISEVMAANVYDWLMVHVGFQEEMEVPESPLD
jgi:hypothetical protein